MAAGRLEHPGGKTLVKMILNLLALEEGLQNIHYSLDHLSGQVPGFKHDPQIINLKDRLQIMEQTLNATLTQWLQLGLGARG